MTTLFLAVLTILLIYALYCLCLGVGSELWMKDHENLRKIRKHFQGEAVYFHPNFYTKTVNLSFSHRNGEFYKELSFVKAIGIYNLTPNGGIRKLLLKEYK